MGLLIEGEWHDQWYDTASHGGRFVRESPKFRHWVTPEGEYGFPAMAGRYHLYVSLACPWAHRALILRKLKGLEHAIGVSVVHPHMLDNGWEYATDVSDELHRFEGTGDRVHGHRYHHELYTLVDPRYTGRVTVPVLWDCERETIVSNESADIIRMFNSGFAGVAREDNDFCPVDLQKEIEGINARVYDHVNNGVGRLRHRARCLRGGLRYSPSSTASMGASPSSAISAASASPRPTGACSPPWCASTPCISGTSSATYAA